MLINKTTKRIRFRDVNLTLPVKQYVCPVCGLEAGTIKETADIQKAISNAYDKESKGARHVHI